MAITEHASTPAVVQQSGAGTSTTAAFSPPANSLLVALVGGGWGNTALMTAAVTDSVGGTWTAAVTAAGTNTSLRGIAAIFYRYLATAPGSMTVSATFTGLQGGRELAVRVLSGAASTQTGAVKSQVNSTATTSGTLSITTTTAASQVYGIADDPNSNNAYTPNGATSLLSSGDFADATDSVRLVSWKATSVTGTPGATTLGGTWAAAASGNIAAFEVLPAVATTFTGSATLAALGALTANATLISNAPPTVTMAGVAALSITATPRVVVGFPTHPRVIPVELFVNGGWVDITSDVYARDSVVITRGRRDETTRAEPSSCTMTLNNRSGNYSPRNPMGIYYGSLGRNTPIRASVVLASDTFARTVASGWGIADTGQVYTVDNSAASVSGNQGKLTTGSAGSFSAVALNDLSLFDADVYAHGVTLPFDTATGAAVIPLAIRLRRYSSTDYVYAWAQVNTSGPVTAGITHATKGVIAAGVSTGITFTAAVGLNLRAQVEGQTYRLKVWPGTSAEPYDWTVTGNSTVSMTPGLVGFQTRTFVGSTNTYPIVTSVAGVTVRVPRFQGEVAAWPQRWDITGNDVYVPIDAAGISRRLLQQAPLQSPLRRYHDRITIAPPVQYWPCEDLKTSQYCDTAISSQPVLLPQWESSPLISLTGNLNDAFIAFGSYSSYPGSAPIVTLPQRGQDTLTPPNPTSVFFFAGNPDGSFDIISPWTPPGGQFMLRFLLTMSRSTPESTTAVEFFTVGINGGSEFISLNYVTGFISITTLNSGYNSGSILFGGDIVDRDILYQLQLTSAGANTNFALTLLGVGSAFSSTFSGTITGVSLGSVFLNTIGGDSLNTYRMGHISVRLQNVSTAGEIYYPLNAWTGEAGGSRFSRLNTEENVPWYYRGDLTQTTLMGPQGSGTVTGGVGNNASLTGQGSLNQTLLDLLYEVEDADLGILYEPRGDIGLEYRTRRDLYSQAPTLVLDYSLGQVAPPLEPVDDDQKTRNNIVVSQPNGLAVEAELTAGPMSTLDPSLGGVGEYNTQYTINTTVSQLADTATFLLSLGTVDEARYPTITVNLANPTVVAASLEPSVLAVNAGDLITITNPKAGVTFDAIRQLVQGYTETLNVFQHTITFNTSPETPYRVAQVGATPPFKVDATTATLVSGVTATATSLSVANVNEPWTTDPTQMPIPITVAGEAMNVTAISGTGSPQTFTVVRSVNQVVKSQAAGASVQLARVRRPSIAY